MYKVWLICACLLGQLPAVAQYAGYTVVSNTEAFRQPFAEASQKTNTIKSDFVQEKNLSMLSEKIISKGKFWFKKTNLVRMEYVQPFTYLVVINKNNVFIQDGQKSNKISTSSNKLFQQINRIMVDCIQGTALNNPDFKTTVYEGRNDFLVELKPVAKGLKDYFSHINIIVGKKDYGVNRIEMHEQSGDYTLINFINKSLNGEIPDALFSIN